jgi:uncharacterized flavoprotein (TIGR03862 family)
MAKKQIIIVGGGPAGLFAADILSRAYDVRIIEKEKNPGQKFLLAGKGGLNITNSLKGGDLAVRYSPAGFMNKALAAFEPIALRHWLSDLGIETFVGSSGRVFPEKGIRSVDVLNKIREKLIKKGVLILTEHELTGFTINREVTLLNKGNTLTIKADYIILALGGASWPQTGSDGSWQSLMVTAGIATKPFQPSNCGITIRWPETIVKYHAGKPLKNIRLMANDVAVKGEAVITEYGMEGNAVYPLVPVLRDMLNNKIPASIRIDFKPLNTADQLLSRLKGKEQKTKEYGELFGLNSVQLALIKAFTNKETYLSSEGIVQSLKELAITVDSLRPLEEAISSVGGISLEEMNEDFSLKKYPWIYAIGEMLDWDAPTGGFLMQGCFSMANYAAQAILQNTTVER